MKKKVFSHCRGCVSYCGLEFNVKDNQIVKMVGNKNSLISEGYKCIKGDMSVELLNGAEFRYQNSQKRGADGELQPIGNDTLMDEVAEIIKTSIAKYGPRSVALYWGTAGYRKSFSVPLAKQFMGAIGSPKMFSTMTIDQSAHWVVKGRMGVFLTGKTSFDDADVIVYTGSNPIISGGNPDTASPLVNQLRKLREFRAAGKELIVVDPRKTETARLASLHLQCIPGTDTEIFAGLIRLVLTKATYNAEFCDRFVTNIEQLRKAVEPFTPEFVSARSGVPTEDLIRAAGIIGKAEKPNIGFATGTSMSPNGNTAGHMVEALNAICAGFNRAGDPVRNPGIFLKKKVTERVLPPRRSWERDPKLRSGHGTLFGEFPTSRLVDDILNEGEDQVKVLLVLGANPMMAFGQPDKFKLAAEKLDSLIVLEPRATETTKLADYIVASPMQYEVADFNLPVESIIQEKSVLQYTDAVVSPPPGTITEWKFFNGLANRLGHTLMATKAGLGSSNHSGGTVLTPDKNWETEDLIEATIAQVGVSMEEVRRHPNGLAMNTASLVFKAQKDDDGARLDLCPDDVAAELASIYETEDSNPAPYKLICRRTVELMNTEFRSNERVQRRFKGGYAPLFVNPEDMQREGFEAGQKIRISGTHGSITGIAKPDPTLLSGVVAMPHGIGSASDAKGNTNHTSILVSMELEHVAPIDGMPQQSSIAVDLTAVR